MLTHSQQAQDGKSQSRFQHSPLVRQACVNSPRHYAIQKRIEENEKLRFGSTSIWTSFLATFCRANGAKRGIPTLSVTYCLVELQMAFAAIGVLRNVGRLFGWRKHQEKFMCT